MPYDRDEGEPPQENGQIVPHLGVLPDPATGRWKGLGPGQPIMIVEDPRNREKIHVFTLVKVNHKEIIMRCRCKDPSCTRVVRFRATYTGKHPQKF